MRQIKQTFPEGESSTLVKEYSNISARTQFHYKLGKIADTECKFYVNQTMLSDKSKVK